LSDSALQARPTPQGSAERSLVLLVGNPNVGKTTLFNRLTGQNARVGNYPGITVERLQGEVRLAADATVDLVDVPGTYSLSARSAEEEVALDAILGLRGNPRPSLCVAVVDAGQLARNLYLVLQLIELRVPLVLALNLIDEVKDNPPDPQVLSRWLGIPCVATNARKGVGLSELKEAIAASTRAPQRGKALVTYPAALEADLSAVTAALPEAWVGGDSGRRRALGLWALTSVDDDDELRDIDPTLRKACSSVRAAAQNSQPPRDLDMEIVGSRYAVIDARLPSVFRRFVAHPPKPKLSLRVDRVLLHPLWGFLVFAVVMLGVFQSLFSWSDPVVHLIELGFAGLANLVREHAPSGMLRDLVTEGLLGGVGNVVVFLPQILLLFFFMGLLEDSGYMARVAFMMDRIMKSLGLHGRAFIPMLSGFACAVPAIMATRTMERQRDRTLTMLVIPLMTCSARLPVYGLIIGALFSSSKRVGFISVASALMLAMYLFSLLTTLLAAAILGRTVVRGKRMPLLIELPPYRLPSLRATARVMLARAWEFLRGAGTMILGCTVVLWLLLSFPKPPASVPEARSPSAASSPSAAIVTRADNASADTSATTPIAYSFGGRLGKAIEPVLAPLGFDWKLGVGIIGAFAAREVFVSTLGLVYGLGDMDTQAIPLRERLRSERRPDGRPRYSPLCGFSLMIFFALSCQCMSTLAVIKRESRSWRWPIFAFVYMTVLAYAASLLVYQGGRLLGFA